MSTKHCWAVTIDAVWVCLKKVHAFHISNSSLRGCLGPSKAVSGKLRDPKFDSRYSLWILCILYTFIIIYLWWCWFIWFIFFGITILYLWCASLGNQDSQHQQLPRRTLGPGLQVGSYSRHWHQYWEAYGAKSSGAAHIESRGCPIPYEMFHRRFQTCISLTYLYYIILIYII